ncbi:DUF1876 domain-containing protein [Jatrophihabitans cynanchi]|jgi:hypothetical protein|uniref:DUF1876 domain-containing protein n=1 Tax=Jatrophihabitans cynanchi TaxID=2944128 RepID=A0ABY7K2X9_9ACTN|nr:DUF1876 domain-containing protein [Jatrophihabitans sp. SB3-54]WAX57661.1 DUF1876 domain-containing protein [Jatrophihabitans sp. SB3-54]
MTHIQEWPIQVWITEEDDRTTARAVLNTRDNVLTADGVARRSPRDPAVPEIGDEIAVGRALAELGRQLLASGADDVAAIEQPR